MTTSVNSTGSGAPIQFSGLASGLDTASIISSLMAVEQVPQQQLQARMASEQSQISALQSINSTISGLSDAAKTFMTGSTWTQLTSTSSNAAFSVTAASTSTAASVSVSVTQSAAGASSIMSASAAQSAFATGSTYTITGGDGKSSTFTVGGTGSVTDIAAAINAATKTSGLSAVVIDPTGSSPSLELISAKTGATSNFAITDAGNNTVLDSSVASTTAGVTTTSGVDAQLSVDGVAMTSSSNTLTIMPGVQLTIPKGVTSSAPATTAVSVTDDGSSRSNAMKTFVSQINSVLSTISSATAYGAITAGQASSGGGVLAGNTDLRDIATQLVNTIFSSSTTVSLGNMGLSVDTTGQLTFDSSAFQTAYQADPQGVQDAFIGSDSFISRVQNIAYQASAPANSFMLDANGKNVLDADGSPKTFSGTLTATISSMNDEVKNYSDQISAWDDRLQMKQTALEKQYADLETKLATLQSQGTWLTSQISSLDGGWSQNSSN